MTYELPILEYAGDLIQALPHSGNDKPIYARTPHGTYHFTIDKVEEVEHNAEDVVVLVLREVEW